MTEKSVFAKYADYVNKYKPDIQHADHQSATVQDYRKRLEEIKQQVYAQNRPQPVQSAQPLQPGSAKRADQVAQPTKSEMARSDGGETAQKRPVMPSEMVQKTATEQLDREQGKLAAVQNYLSYLQLNTLQQQTPVASQKLLGELPDDRAVQEAILVRECCEILLGAKLTNNICITETECQVNPELPAHQQALIRKIVFQQTMNRMEVITKYKLFSASNALCQRLAELLYEAITAVDAATYEVAAECDNLILLDSRLNGTYQTLSVLARFSQTISSTANIMQQLEQFSHSLAGLNQAKTIEFILYQMCQFYAKQYLYQFIESGKVQNEFMVSFDAERPLLSQFYLNMNKIALFQPVEQDILILGRNNYIFSSIFELDCDNEEEAEENALKRLASQRLTLENITRKLLPDNPSQFYALIYSHAKQSYTRLLKLLMNNYKLKQGLTAIWRFFLLQASDLFYIFLETSALELDKPVQSVNVLRLNNLFKLACYTSSVRFEHFMENFQIRISQYTFLQLFHLVNDGDAKESEQADAKVGNMLYLEFKCPKELRLVFTEPFLLQLNLAFRRIIRQKQVDSMLNKAWLILNQLKNVSKNVSVFNFIYKLLNQMQDFSRQLEFQTNCVLLESYAYLEEELQKAESVDQVSLALTAFAKLMLKQLRLTDTDTSMLLDTLFADCLVFCRFITQYFELQQGDVVRELDAQMQKIQQFKRGLLGQIESSKVAIRKLSDSFGQKVEKWRSIVGM